MRKFFSPSGSGRFVRRGSHVFYRHADGMSTTAPNHPGRDIARPLIREILWEIEITPDEFQVLLKQ